MADILSGMRRRLYLETTVISYLAGRPSRDVVIAAHQELTWNCKHLANAVHRNRIEALAEEAGYACPVICTPEELMED